MTKREFLEELAAVLPSKEREERLHFYSEMIDDRMEEGASEEEAVASVGNLSAILDVEQPTADSSHSAKRCNVWHIVLLAVGSPLWIALLAAAVAVTLSLYVSLWTVVISLWAVFVALIACAFGGVVGGAVLMGQNVPTGLALIAAAMVCTGLSILLFYGCKAATSGLVALTKKAARRLFRKERPSCV